MKCLLGKLHDERWNWALDGKEEYESGFLRLRIPEGGKKRTLIGVYGPTQVGKTTLILKLLGIKEEMIIELSRALRGKSRLGNSATVTTSIFQQSKCKRFKIIFPDKRIEAFDTLSELEEAMCNVRYEVETRKYSDLKPLIIQISSLYFDMEELNSRNQEIEILDLPGDNSKNKNEIEHVTRCLKEYLSQCRLCILVEIVDKMLSLTQINREFVQDWKEKPNNFRIVLTRAATSSSILTNIRNQSISTNDDFKNVILNQFRNQINDSAKRVRVYPVEFGDSWEGLKSSEPKVFKIAKTWINENFRELYDDLCSVTSPENEILHSKQEVDYVEKVSMEELSKHNFEKSQLLERVEIKTKNRSRKLIIIKEYQKYIKEIKDDIEIIKESYNFSAYKLLKNEEWNNRLDSLWKKRKDIESNILYYSDKINENYFSQIEKINRSLKSMAYKNDVSYKDIQFKTCDLEMESIANVNIKEIYISKRKYKEDTEKCMLKLGEYSRQCLEVLKKDLSMAKGSLIYKLKVKTEVYDNKVKNLEIEIKIIENEIKQLEEEVAAINKNIRHATDEWEKDKKRTEEFYLYLKKSFIRHSEEFKEKIKSSHTTSEEKWIYHQYWNLMMIDLERICKNE